MELRLGYKRTEVGVIPEDWECLPIADLAAPIANAIVGGPFGSDLVSADYVHDGVPVIRGQNMGGRYLEGPYAYVTEAKANSLSANLAQPGDVVFTQRGTLGQVSLTPNEPFDLYLVSQSQMKVTLHRDKVTPDFLFSWFESNGGQQSIASSAIQTGVPHINLGILKSLMVPIPQVAEQRAIATALSDVDALLTRLDRLIAKKRDIKQAAMQQLLTGKTRLPGFGGSWRTLTFGELGTTYGGLVGKSKADFGSGDAQYVTFLNVMSNSIVDPELFDRVRVTDGEAQNLVRRGDLLFNGSSETPEEVGMCALVACDVPSLYLNSFCFGLRLRDDSEVNGLFLSYLIRGEPGRTMMKSLAQGSTRYNISKAALRHAPVSLPELQEQTAIATLLSDLDAELAALEARRDKTRALKQGMMQALLTGKTRLI